MRESSKDNYFVPLYSCHLNTISSPFFKQAQFIYMQMCKCPHLDLYFINIKLSGDYDRYTKSDKTHFRGSSFFFFSLTSRKKNADLGQLATGSVQSLWPINYNDMINNIL